MRAAALEHMLSLIGLINASSMALQMAESVGPLWSKLKYLGTSWIAKKFGILKYYSILKLAFSSKYCGATELLA